MNGKLNVNVVINMKTLVKTKLFLTLTFGLPLIFVGVRAHKIASNIDASQENAHTLKGNERIIAHIKSSSPCNLLILNPTRGNDVIFDEKFNDAIKEEKVDKAHIIWCNANEKYVYNLFNKDDDIYDLPPNTCKRGATRNI